MDRTPSDYTNTIYQSILRNYENLMNPDCMYYGKQGALRLAREYGYGLAAWGEHEYNDEVGASYGKLLVRLSNLKPPIDAKEWIGEIRKSINSANVGRQ